MERVPSTLFFMSKERQYLISGTFYKTNPNGFYALYLHKGQWRESASITNQRLINLKGKELK
ncbi:MAG: hypothetical protein Tp152SUR00d2C52646391_36 [Prokaryotic dsDNA virus sp.]|nr:MAG: hypothetical protein Tp152SUR00d2C52646391_36 [Prokaryotic dsDNA virus sp.]|tara:strand:- start:596 stop:781 length:186 start_codon:yes stop_codon:yes gene_type:complete